MMLSKLRSVCVLSRQVHEVRIIIKIINLILTLQQELNDTVFEKLKVPLKAEVKKVKRKVGYRATEDEGESTSEAMKRLRLDEKMHMIVTEN